MDIIELGLCEDMDDFSDLIMKDIICGYNNSTAYPDHKLVAVVDHAANYDIKQLKTFFETVHNELEVQFRIGDGLALIIDGTKFHRSFLYSSEDSLISKLFDDGIFRMQDPVIERCDGMTIDLKDLTITFKNDGEVLTYDSTEEMKKAINKILMEYWPELDHPDICIRDSISNHPGTKWMVESFSDWLMASDSQEKSISLAKQFEKFIPGLNFRFHPEDYLPFEASLQLATQLTKYDFRSQDEFITKLIQCFGFFDDYISQEDS